MSEREIKETIDHFVEMYSFDLKRNYKAYATYYKHNQHSEIIIDFLRRVKIPANVRLIKTTTRTCLSPNMAGCISLNTENPILFASKEFKRIRFEIKIDKSEYESYETFILTLIHELSHLVLYSTLNKHRDSEIATDLFVMTSGLYEEKLIDKRIKIDSPGYITSKQVDFAYRYIKTKRNFTESKGFIKEFYRIKLWLI